MKVIVNIHNNSQDDIEMFPEERQQEIIRYMNRNGRVSVNDLSQLFGVSEVTIRADLQILAEQNRLIRTHGGAVPVSQASELSLNIRRQLHPQEKDQIAKIAARLIENGDSIFLDTSSTALAIVRHLQNHRDLTILTNSLALAEVVLTIPSITLVLFGGTLQRETMSFVGTDGLEVAQKYNINKGFFGAHGINAPQGLTDVSAAEAEVKRNIINLCRVRYAILDRSKWGRVGLASFASIDQLSGVVSDLQEPHPIKDVLLSFNIPLYLP